MLKSTLTALDVEELRLFLPAPHPHFQMAQGWKDIADGFGSLRAVEGEKPPSLPSAKILHTLILTVDGENYFRFNEQIYSVRMGASILAVRIRAEMFH